MSLLRLFTTGESVRVCDWSVRVCDWWQVCRVFPCALSVIFPSFANNFLAKWTSTPITLTVTRNLWCHNFRHYETNSHTHFWLVDSTDSWPLRRTPLQPHRCAFGSWYLTGTKKFHSTIMILVGRKWKSQLSWEIKPVPHNLVRRIRCWSIWSSAQGFVYLYCKISQTVSFHVSIRQ